MSDSAGNRPAQSSEWSRSHSEMFRLHALVAKELDGLLSVHLNERTDRRFRLLTDAVDVEALSPSARATWAATHDVREGLTAAIYHQRNVVSLERAVIAVCRREWGSRTGLVSNPATMAVNERRLTIEYHGFLFAIRRTIEYLAVCVAAYFDKEAKSFRRLDRAISQARPAEAAARVADRARLAVTELHDVLGTVDDRPTRDRVAHRQPVQPGQLNITLHRDGAIAVRRIGGAEAFGIATPLASAEPELGLLLADRCDRVEMITFELLRLLPDFEHAADRALAI